MACRIKFHGDLKKGNYERLNKRNECSIWSYQITGFTVLKYNTIQYSRV